MNKLYTEHQLMFIVGHTYAIHVAATDEQGVEKILDWQVAVKVLQVLLPERALVVGPGVERTLVEQEAVRVLAVQEHAKAVEVVNDQVAAKILEVDIFEMTLGGEGFVKI